MAPADHNDLSLLGSSPAFVAVMEQVSRVAPLDRPVLVIGERGTGKELVSARLHYLSRRWDRPFVKLNCATLAESLLETELFGHEAGSFTGATRRHLGRFEIAHEGSLFLDELANASARVQEKILRVIEYGEFERVGGRETIRTNVRLVAATNLDLPAEARAGRFREDLLDRLAFDVITLPPLRARPEDILDLADHFATRMSQELRRELFPGFAPRAQRQLLEHPWPGNVRELRNVIERAVYRMEDPDEEIEDILFDPFASPWRPRAAPGESVPSASAPSPTPASAGIAAVPRLPCDLRAEVERIEIEWLQTAMRQARFNQRKAAELLQLSYHQLRGYLRKYRLVGAESEDEG
ncbi:MAG: phage shock protein operon transcriptional activator [Xanthomonadales bacterium]|nr:Psp operon transcriptional activator [Xanthomonadales bacterium]MCC6591984.1 phage shock protein operon transcriptional activator [Xanthomonadales bacterium]MCE7930246.1 phage shock protein operon transcriptional activator [Xanthomonadales bacterium PRO6]